MTLPDYIFKRMTDEESKHLVYLSFCGIRQGDMILMGMEAYTRYNNYIAEMIKKYSKKGDAGKDK